MQSLKRTHLPKLLDNPDLHIDEAVFAQDARQRVGLTELEEIRSIRQRHVYPAVLPDRAEHDPIAVPCRRLAPNAECSPAAEVSGLDFSAEAVAIARRNISDVEFTEGNAQNLPYAAGIFDCVLCGYGLMHLPEPDRALSEMLRVLKPGGRAAFSVWGEPAPGNGYGLMFGAIKQHGRLDVPLPDGPDFFQFSEPDALPGVLGEYGFVDVEVRIVQQLWEMRRPGDLLDAILDGAVRLRAVLKAQELDAFVAIRQAVEAGMETFRSGNSYRMPMPAVVVGARKP